MAKTSSLVVSFTPMNEAQKEALELFPRATILALAGVAGTGKSQVALAMALQQVRRGLAPEGVVLLKPPVEAGSGRLGYLPGDKGEKIDPHFAYYKGLLGKISVGFPPHVLRKEAICYLRGVTFERCVVILDEAQNCTVQDLWLVISRLGVGSKLIVVGDSDQIDLTPPLVSGFEPWLDAMEDGVCRRIVEGFDVVEFRDEDIVRHPLMRGWAKCMRPLLARTHLHSDGGPKHANLSKGTTPHHRS
jgi:phosphate starvation-inducible protein PhoH and related proteins